MNSQMQQKGANRDAREARIEHDKRLADKILSNPGPLDSASVLSFAFGRQATDADLAASASEKLAQLKKNTSQS